MRARVALVSAVLAAVLSLPALAADARIADVCLEFAEGAVTESEWPALADGIAAAVESRPLLFPAPTVSADLGRRFDIWSGGADPTTGSGAACLERGSDWTARFGRDFLEAGADRMLAEAPTTPGISSDVTIEWYPDEARLRTSLVFAGPLDIPNGTCWVDDALSVDSASGTIVASGEQGLETSLFAEGACGRFFDHLPDGGAGEQAVTLLPVTVDLGDGRVLRLVAEDVVVAEDALTVVGSLRRD